MIDYSKIYNLKRKKYSYHQFYFFLSFAIVKFFLLFSFFVFFNFEVFRKKINKFYIVEVIHRQALLASKFAKMDKFNKFMTINKF